MEKGRLFMVRFHSRLSCIPCIDANKTNIETKKVYIETNKISKETNTLINLDNFFLQIYISIAEKIVA